MDILSRKFSVLMSVYCKERPEFFDLSLESNLVKQTLRPDEFVLVCDGELTPELDAVIEKYQSMFPEVVKVYRKENGGLGKALNYGLPKCSHSLVARSDSDDICVEDRFEKQVRYMEEHPEVGVVSSYIDEFDTDWTKPNNVKTLPLDHEELYERAKLRNPLNHLSVMMRKEVILGVGSYRHVPYAEDYDLWIRALVAGVKLGNVGQVLVHARVGNGMVERRGDKRCISSYKVLNGYMLDHGMIGMGRYMFNMMAISVFVYMPLGLKRFVYKNVFR